MDEQVGAEASPVPDVADGFSDGQMSRLKVESLLLTAVYGLNALVGVAFWAVAARTVSLAQLGSNIAIISAFTAAAVVAATGMANAFLAMVPIAGHAQGMLLRYGYALAVGTCVVTGAVAGVAAVAAVPGIGHPLWTVVAITATSAVWGVFVIQDAVLVAFGKARWLLYENLPVSIVKLGLLPVLAAGLGDTSHPVVLATALPALVASAIVSGVVLPRLVRSNATDRDSTADEQAADAQEWMAGHRREFQLFALRDGAASAMNLGLLMFLPFLVTAAAGFEQGAVFSLCLQISNAMDLFTVGVGISLTASVASNHASGPAAARAMWKRLARIIALVAVAVIAGAPLVLRAFGPEFIRLDGWAVVAILAVGALLRTTFEVWTALLRALRRTGVLLAWTSVSAASLFVAVLIGASRGGAVGAAIGVSSAAAVSCVIGGLGLLGRLDRPVRPPFWQRGPMTDWPWEGFEPAPMDGVIESATWFGPADRPRFGWLSLPDSGTSPLGVVLCPPIGEESRSAHRTYRRIGSELARRGIVALRVDYDGCGDSAGGQHDPGRVAAWRASIVDAANELRSMGLPDVAVVGMRMGATLAAGLAAETGFSSVVLWDPCSNGRSFLREGATLQKLTGFHTAARNDDSVETPGFVFDGETAADLRTVSLSTLPRERWCERLLVLTRTGKPIMGAPAAGLSGSHVDWAEATGQDRVVGVEPNEARTPVAAIEQVADWLAAGVDDTQAVPFTRSPRTEAVFEDARTGRSVRERIVSLGPDRLFGIVTEPLEPRADAPWIGLVNVAVELHIGPGRRWVDYARSWAGLGLRCVRFDQSGVGNSPLRPGQREDRLFDPLWLDDIPNLIDGVDTVDAEAPIALFGLCSGGYSAFEAAMRRDIDALFCVSTGFGLPWFSPGRPAHSDQRIAGRAFPRPFATVFYRNTRLAFALWRIWYQFTPWNAPMAVVHGVLRRGTTVRLLANRQDARGFRDAAWWSVVRRLAIMRTRRFGLRVVPQLEHALMTQWSQDVIYDDATRFWLERYAGHASGSDALPAGPDPIRRTHQDDHVGDRDRLDGRVRQGDGVDERHQMSSGPRG